MKPHGQAGSPVQSNDQTWIEIISQEVPAFHEASCIHG